MSESVTARHGAQQDKVQHASGQQHEPGQHESGPPRWLITLIAAATGVLVANLYYTQPLIGTIAPNLHMPGLLASFLVTLTQVGYAIGLTFVVPLGDLRENRRLIVRLTGITTVGLAVAAIAPDWGVFLAAALAIGVTSCAAQILIPMAAGLVPPEARGRIAGNVMAGLLVGILLARPASSIIAYAAGWRTVYAIGAVLMAALAVALRLGLPEVQPGARHSYPELISSLFRLFRTEPTLRRRAAYQCAAFGAFTLYWTAAPLLLIHEFGYTQRGIAVFALIGAAGAVSAPLAGRLADRGYGRFGTAAALTSIAIAFAISAVGAAAHSVVILAAAGVLLDMAVQANNVFGQRAIFTLAPEHRARLNGAYMAALFVGGAAGSAVASVLVAEGWSSVAIVGAVPSLMALAYFAANEVRRRRRGEAPHE